MIIHVEAFGSGYPGTKQYDSTKEGLKTILEIGILTNSLPDSLRNKPLGPYNPQYRKNLEGGNRGYVISFRGHVLSEGLRLQWWPGYTTPSYEQLFVPRSHLEHDGLEGLIRVSDKEWMVKLKVQPEITSQPGWQTKKGVFE